MKRIVDLIKDRNVAIVGNASAIIGSRQGEEIDSHDIVIRINKGVPTEDNYVDIGKKTHVWVFGGGDKDYSPYTEELEIQYNPIYTVGINSNNKYKINDVIKFPYKLVDRCLGY